MLKLLLFFVKTLWQKRVRLLKFRRLTNASVIGLLEQVREGFNVPAMVYRDVWKAFAKSSSSLYSSRSNVSMISLILYVSFFLFQLHRVVFLQLVGFTFLILVYKSGVIFIILNNLPFTNVTISKKNSNINGFVFFPIWHQNTWIMWILS